MSQLTSKELSSIEDQLHLEDNLVKKYTAYAENTSDTALKNKFNEVAGKHRKHFDALYAQLR